MLPQPKTIRGGATPGAITCFFALNATGAMSEALRDRSFIAPFAATSSSAAGRAQSKFAVDASASASANGPLSLKTAVLPPSPPPVMAAVSATDGTDSSSSADAAGLSINGGTLSASTSSDVSALLLVDGRRRPPPPPTAVCTLCSGMFELCANDGVVAAQSAFGDSPGRRFGDCVTANIGGGWPSTSKRMTGAEESAACSAGASTSLGRSGSCGSRCPTPSTASVESKNIPDVVDDCRARLLLLFTLPSSGARAAGGSCGAWCGGTMGDAVPTASWSAVRGRSCGGACTSPVACERVLLLWTEAL
mmetsp:Transcript_51296/g.158135  ORF Transcript_51296/g.158135 Transcript_51296/m.158135 type:complete len:306 (+) Transcript_51296:337-1254(+)